MLSSIMNFTSTHDMTRAINLWDKNIFHNYNEWPWDLINNNLDFCKNYHLTDEQYNKAKDIYMAYIFSLIFKMYKSLNSLFLYVGVYLALLFIVFINFKFFSFTSKFNSSFNSLFTPSMEVSPADK